LFPVARDSNPGAVFVRITKQTSRHSVAPNPIHRRAYGGQLSAGTRSTLFLFISFQIFLLLLPDIPDPPFKLFTVTLRNIFKDFYCCLLAGISPTRRGLPAYGHLYGTTGLHLEPVEHYRTFNLLQHRRNLAYHPPAVTANSDCFPHTALTGWAL
jgi:hypothetical protein